MALSNIMTGALLSADTSRQIANVQHAVRKQMDGHAGVLDAEIKLDSARGRTFRSNNKYAVCGERRFEEGIPGRSGSSESRKGCRKEKSRESCREYAILNKRGKGGSLLLLMTDISSTMNVRIILAMM